MTIDNQRCPLPQNIESYVNCIQTSSKISFQRFKLNSEWMFLRSFTTIFCDVSSYWKFKMKFIIKNIFGSIIVPNNSQMKIFRVIFYSDWFQVVWLHENPRWPSSKEICRKDIYKASFQNNILVLENRLLYQRERSDNQKELIRKPDEN